MRVTVKPAARAPMYTMENSGELVAQMVSFLLVLAE